jgi:fatty-acyl-CoA synthase
MDSNGKTARLCARNEIGMLQIRSPGLTPGYLNPKHDQAARTEDGWLITGDLGRIDDDDYVFVTGRAKDVIIRGGHNIDPALIEEPLVQAPDVLIAAAVGKPDAYAGELPVAYVQLVAGSTTTSAELLTFLEGRITERAAVPKEIHIVEQMPLTDIGKPKKNVLRDMAAEREFTLILSQATSLTDQGEGRRLQVCVQPHPAHGTQVDIQVFNVAASEQATIEAQIHAAMSPFAHARAVTVHPLS